MVTLLTKSSGQLQSVFKLWDMGMMLIFGPTPDFIALSLRPVTLLMMQQFIIPFYKSVYPFFRDYRIKMGSLYRTSSHGDSHSSILPESIQRPRGHR